ncbi:unnamed protein product [Rotaria socialis]|uniref:Uncharacterized protein n=1 Tax=Rotaria socialis TaxID=392032 RepID=A0A817R3K2_9BILA|nr:unnamed protein product [Rotaria socialis]CAF3370200.1 unnamed protein product [Rotaria socialis]CAF3399463.1 unnamed protein product [Rotaria socialis]CAF3559119.1 unnamed protein product [Rotaria socialis]CAF3651786.1 unnamed protein product [Rotaria socialis]
MTATYTFVNNNDLETVCLVWLDASVNISSENIATQKELRSIIHHFKTFSNAPDCKQYIQQKSQYDRVFLIASGRLGQEIVPHIHHYRQVFNIYVYCHDKEKNEEWARKFIKVKTVQTRLDTLINRIQSDYSKRCQFKLDEPFPINISKTNNLSDELLHDDIFHSQLLIDCLLQMKTLSTDVTGFVNTCLQQYNNDPNQTSIIHEFKQKYSSDKILWWYTQDSFVYRLLSKAMNVKNYNFLLNFGFLIRDICGIIQKYQLKSSIEVYRGQIMSIDEFNTLKSSLGQNISINTFVSTDYDRKSIISSLNEFPITNDSLRVLFEIHADPNVDNSRPFANITSLTYSPHQQQVLFMLGSVFQLTDIQQDKKYGIWIVKTVLKNLKKSYDEKDLVACGRTLQKMGRNDEAEMFFLRLLKEMPSNHEDISKCYSTLGYLSFLKNNYDSSLNWYENFLKVSKPDDPNLADIYYSIGCVYQNMFEYNQALQYYDRALLIWKEIYGDEGALEMAECLNNMGCIYEKEQYYSKALSCHQQALSIRDKFHADIGRSYNNIGNIYFAMGEYNSAIENYNFAFQEKCNYASPQDPSLATTLRNIALVFEEDKNFLEALNYFKRAASIYENLLPSTHIDNVEVQEDIRRISSFIKS